MTSSAVGASNQAPSLSNLLNPDGTLNLSSGFSGSLDARGFRMEHTASGAPRFVPAVPTVGDDDNWDSQFNLSGQNGLDGPVYALAVSGSDIYVGGSFTAAGGASANNIARWNGSTWAALGEGVNSVVYALAVSGSDIYAGGVFTQAGGVSALYIARWNGSSWAALGGGVNSAVHALAVSGSNLFVGGFFTMAGGVNASRIARWNGSNWSALGDGVDSAVFALAVSGSNLFAGGAFTTAGIVNASRIARWNGSSWSALGDGVSSGGSPIVYALTVSGNDLYVGGEFTMAGTVSASRIAHWNGSNWSALGDGVLGPVFALAVSGGDLFAGGNFTQAGGVSANRIARWNGSSWAALGGGVPGVVNELAVNGSDLFVGGSFMTAGGVDANNIARWNGSSWSTLIPGVNGTVWAVAVNGDNLYVGGDFTTAGTVNANRIARWDGRNWSALGSGVNNTVRALAVLGNELYAGGDFTQAGGMNANRIARWNIPGGGWSALGSGANNGVNNSVYALAVKGSELYAGGFFTTAGGISANYVAKWSSGNWSALGSGVADGPVFTIVYALAVIGDNLYAGGSFLTAGGGSAKYIARWDTIGNNWFSLGTGASNGATDFVRAFAVSGSNLYVGGNFGGAGGILSPQVARWSISGGWAAVGNGMFFNNHVLALAVSGNNLYAGGYFTTAGGVSASKIAHLNIATNTWSALGSGANGHVYALAIIGNDVIDPDIVAGGEFTNVGGVDANRVAFWNGVNAWSAIGSGNGVNDDVNVLAVNGSDVYVGGFFTLAGKVSASYIARWNGRTWSALGSGLDGAVYALAISGNDLYVGGYFTTAGGVGALNIARWNIPNSNWTALGLGVNDVVYALAVDGSNLYVGGEFTTAGGVEAKRIARWNGSWASVGSGANNGVNDSVYALAVIGGNLYVGGYFTMAGGASANGIARWNGSSWSALGSGTNNGVNDGVRALAVSGSDLYVGGLFTMAGTASASRIARWDGSNWWALGSGVNDDVRALAVRGTDLYVGGDFEAIGGISVPYIAKWDGNNWAALGSGLNNDSTALVVNGSFLYAAGDFTTAGGKPSNFFGKYLLPSCAAITVNPTNPALSAGTTGQPYSQTISASGGTAPYSFITNPAALPNGLTLAANGTLSGTPTISGNFNFTVTATDANGCTGARSYTLVINACPILTVNPATLPAGTIGQSYNQTLMASGGTAPYSFGISAGALPVGLNLAAGGLLNGTPAQFGNFNFTVQASDANGCTGTRAYALTINCPLITLAPATLPNGTVGTAYSQMLSATGGAASYTFSLMSGALPAGLTLSNSGTLSGTPSASGTFANLVIKATDANNCTGTRTYTLTIACQAITVNPAALPTGTVGAAYNQSLTQIGGVGAVNFTVSAGALPAGLALAANGVLSGTPGAAGTFNFTARTTDVNGCFGERLYNLAVCPVITVNPATLPSGLSGIAYNQMLSATGGTAPYSFAVMTGALPPGLALSAGGVLSGTPATNGTFNFTVMASDAGGCAGARAYALVIGACPAFTFSPPALPAGTSGASYNQTLTVSGGAAPYTFSLSAGALPGGLTLAPSGLLSGTPIQTGSFNFTVSATDNNGCVGTQAYTLVINCPGVTVNPATVPAGTVGTSYTQTFTQTGGSGAITFSLTGTLPTGLSFNPAAATLSGMPAQSGSFNFTVRAGAANGCFGERNYALVINCQTITVNPATLPVGTVGTAYNQTITHSGGLGVTVFSLSAGTLPTGLALSPGGVLSGTPGASGSSNFTVRATDNNGCAGDRAYALVINCPAITVNPTTLPQGTVGLAYNQTLTATGGTSPYTFAVTNGTLPAGLALTSGGLLSGTPASSGSFNFTVTTTNNLGCTSTRNYALVIVNCPALTLNPLTLPAGTVGAVYNQTVTAQGGSTPYTFSLSAGTLPTGVTLATGGLLSGTPTQTGTFTITLKATDNSGCMGTQTYALLICPAIAVNPASLPSGVAGLVYNQMLTALGGVAPYNFTVSAGALPNGLSLASSGALAGTPTSFGNFNFTVTATDANGCTGARAYALTINAPCTTITVSPALLPNGFVGTAYSQALTATGGTGPHTFAVTAGALPNGLTLASGGALTGMPTVASLFSFTVTATASTGCTGVRSYTVMISGNGLQFFPLPAPVRLLDTRPGASPNACSQPNAPITGQTSRIQPGRNFCTIPANAAALTGNVTTVASGGGFLTLYPSDATQPTVASTNYGVNEIINNVFTVGLGAADGAFKIFANHTTDVVVDVTGYYAPPNTGGLFFHALPVPVRLLETRAGFNGCVTPGAPLTGNAESIQQAISACTGIPATARAIVGNATTVNPLGGGFLTIFPADAVRPLVASSNFNTGQVVNGPFAVGLAATGQFKIFTTSTTDLVVDVLGYYSPEVNDANGAGLLLTPLARPIRLLETRPGLPVGCFKPGAPLLGGAETTQTARGLCDGLTIPANALGVVGNATVVFPVGAGFLTLWPSTAARPLVATSNYNPGDVGNRHFIVGLGMVDGAFKIYTHATSDLVVDLSGYFAP